MKDWYKREIEYVRVSVTQKCNLKCVYCKPDDKGTGHVEGGEVQCARDVSDSDCTPLTPQEFEAIVRVMADLGIKKVRITGGEPLTRNDICDIVERISKIPGLSDLSMTTNGINLSKLAHKLKKAGLERLNISMDSLESKRFKYITGGGNLKEVLKGIDKALEVGLLPVKVNTVLVKGLNDHEFNDFVALAKDRPLEVRFIELMPIGRFGEENADKIVYNKDIIDYHPELIPCDNILSNHPARYYTLEGYEGKIGFISPMSHKFCQYCNRIRLTCDGKIKPCLGDNGEVNIIEILRNDPKNLKAEVERAIYQKPEGHNFEKSFNSARNMSMIGG